MNNGMHMIGGFVKVEIVLANLSFDFIFYNINIIYIKYDAKLFIKIICN